MVAKVVVEGKSEPKLRRLNRVREETAGGVGGNEVVQHTKGRLVNAPRAQKMRGDVGLDDDPASERIEHERRIRPEVADDVVTRKPDPGERDACSAPGLDVDDREQNREAAPAGEHEIEHRVVRVVVLVAISVEAVLETEDAPAGIRVLVGRLALCRREVCPQPVEFPARGVGVHLPELGGEGEGDLVERRPALCGKRCEGRDLQA